VCPQYFARPQAHKAHARLCVLFVETEFLKLKSPTSETEPEKERKKECARTSERKNERVKERDRERERVFSRARWHSSTIGPCSMCVCMRSRERARKRERERESAQKRDLTPNLWFLGECQLPSCAHHLFDTQSCTS